LRCRANRGLNRFNDTSAVRVGEFNNDDGSSDAKVAAMVNLSWETMAVYAPLLALVATAAVTDVRARRIPNWLTLTVALSGLAQSVTPFAVISPTQSILGLLSGFGITFLLYMVGGRGAGDVKLTAGIGAWLGPWPVLIVLAAAAVVSLVLAVALSAVRGRLGQLFQSTGVMLIGLLNVRRLGAQSVIDTGRRAGGSRGSIDRPLPNAVSVLVATACVVVWVSASSAGIGGAR
jgi:prepilin peptidase CpaA